MTCSGSRARLACFMTPLRSPRRFALCRPRVRRFRAPIPARTKKEKEPKRKKKLDKIKKPFYTSGVENKKCQDLKKKSEPEFIITIRGSVLTANKGVKLFIISRHGQWAEATTVKILNSSVTAVTKNIIRILRGLKVTVTPLKEKLFSAIY
jgi:hypothetical protein